MQTEKRSLKFVVNSPRRSHILGISEGALDSIASKLAHRGQRMATRFAHDPRTQRARLNDARGVPRNLRNYATWTGAKLSGSA